MQISALVDTVVHNQVVTGLSFTAALGAIIYQLRSLPHLVSQGTLRFLTVEVTVTSSDASFDWMDRWLANQPYASRAKMLTLQSNSTDLNTGASPAQETSWSLSPGPGLHMFWWRSRPVFLERRYLTKDGGDDTGRRNKPIETLRFRTIGRSQAIIRRLIADVREFSLASNMVSIRVWSDYWLNVPAKCPRPLDSVILPDRQTERIVDDLRWFVNAREWYRQRGIPYRRGYLFAGPPGTGKTSFVMALAGHFNWPICILTLNSDMDDHSLLSAFSEAPANAIILIEDVDCAFPGQTRDPEKEQGRLTKAGLLNAIDGVATPDGRIVIMTSNFPERLDPALVRPGRADVHEYFELLGPLDQQRMARRFYDEHFAPVLMPVSPAVLQGVFMQHPTDPRAAHQALVDAMV